MRGPDANAWKVCCLNLGRKFPFGLPTNLPTSHLTPLLFTAASQFHYSRSVPSQGSILSTGLTVFSPCPAAVAIKTRLYRSGAAGYGQVCPAVGLVWTAKIVFARADSSLPRVFARAY
ncbi:unnamed protein product [Protopolystoma xenopodis]|uniref:Uncharacterized protein n=1 Tax=Protopolystoma xenopodis TaxID=117903 RepID=A0A3S5FFP5_9PLAT|nr:unnamed protein product [Protopolystoma xenopodis]